MEFKNENILVVDSDNRFAKMLIGSLKALSAGSEILWVNHKTGLKELIEPKYSLAFVDNLCLINESDYFINFFKLNKLCNLIVLIPEAGEMQTKTTIKVIENNINWGCRNFILKSDYCEKTLPEILSLILFSSKYVND